MWFEELPTQCPPEQAYAPNNAVFYRLTESSSFQCSDFWSQRKIYPTKQFNATECRAKSLSIFDNLASAKKLRLLPVHANKVIASISLPQEAGVIQQTGRDQAHYSWWRAAAFDPSSICKLEEET